VRNSTPIILLVLIIGLGFLVTHLENTTPTTQERKEIRKQVWDMDPDAVNQIRIYRAGLQLLSFVKETDTWQINEPFQVPAKGSMIKSFLDSLSRIKTSRRISLETEADRGALGPFGLSDSSRWIEIQMSGGSTQKIHIGSRTPVGTDRFAQVEGQHEVLVISAELIDWTGWDLDKWRDQRALAFDPYDVSQFSVRVGERQFSFERPSIDWLMVDPIRFPAHRDTINTLLSKCARIEIQSFLVDQSPQLDAYGLDRPKGEIRVTLRSDGSEKTLIWGNLVENKENEMAGMQVGGQSVWGIDPSIQGEIEKSLEGVRRTEALSFWPYQIKSLQIIHQENALEWNQETVEHKERIEALIRKLRDFRAHEFIDTPQDLKFYGLDEPRASVIALLDAPEREERLLLGNRREGDEVYVKLATYPSVFVLDSAALDLIKQEVDFWNKPSH
jgi:hypothetical protein